MTWFTADQRRCFSDACLEAWSVNDVSGADSDCHEARQILIKLTEVGVGFDTAITTCMTFEELTPTRPLRFITLRSRVEQWSQIARVMARVAIQALEVTFGRSRVKRLVILEEALLGPAPICRVASYLFLREVGQISAPSGRAVRLAGGLLYMHDRSFGKALQMISELPTGRAMQLAMEPAIFAFVQRNDSAAIERLYMQAASIVDQKERALALLAFRHVWEDWDRRQLQFIHDLRRAVNQALDPRTTVYCGIHMNENWSELKGPFDQFEDPRFKLDALDYLIASERHGLNMDVAELICRYTDLVHELPNVEQVEHVLRLAGKLIGFGVKDNAIKMLLEIAYTATAMASTCEERRKCALAASRVLPG